MIKNILSLKNIKNLTKILIKNTFYNLYIIDKNNNKINKKSIFFWMLCIISIAIAYISYEIIKILVQINQPLIFLNALFLLLVMLIIFQAILASVNIFYFSKDLEYLLPLPIKPEELLISKFNTLICNLYITEILLGVIPLILYGLFTNANILFYFYSAIILLLLPILFAAIVNIIMSFVMKLSRLIKNKDIFQMIITFVLMFIFVLVEFKLINTIFNNKLGSEEEIKSTIINFNEKIENINKYFLIINPSVKILENANKINSIFELIKIIIINFISILIFLFIGKINYLKDILKNNNYIKVKKENKINLEKKCKKRKIKNSYILKEFKSLFKNPIFFMQCVYPTLVFLITIITIVIILAPQLKSFIVSDLFKEYEGAISIDISVIYLILTGIQLLFTLSNISLTAISREGKNAILMKYIPVDLYKQFVYKNIPQVFLNTFIVLSITLLIKYVIPSFSIIYLFLIFILGMLLNIINSCLMLIVDLKRPNLNWDTEYEVMKQNNNKIFQYVLTILTILLLVYFEKIFTDFNLINSIILTIIILFIILFLINIYARKNINKLFEKIN